MKKKTAKGIARAALTALAVFAMGVPVCCLSVKWLNSHNPSSPAPPGGRPPVPRPPKPYSQTLAELDARRRSLAAQYATAARGPQRRGVLDEARQAFVDAAARRIVPYWYGTRWAFEGTTERPGEGSIACGYFVATVLRDAGLRVERARLAQQAAERIILSLTDEEHVRRFRGVPLGRFVQAARGDGEGLYIVGLDSHVGLMLVEPDGAFFIHSSGLEPWCVIREPAQTAAAIANSEYRIYGKISADDRLIRRWLSRQEIPTRVR